MAYRAMIVTMDDPIVQEALMRRSILLATLTTILFAASCTFTSVPQGLSVASDMETFHNSYLTTFDILNGSTVPSERALAPFNTVISSSQARATVPIFTSTFVLPDTGTTAATLLTDYPEEGQDSTWTVEKTSTDTVYLVKVTTTFKAGDLRDHQDEWYYIKSSDTYWNSADPICTADGTLNDRYRAKNELVFDDGSVQTEKIVDVRYYADHTGFATFSIDGSLEYPGAFLPQTDTNASYSSVVVYSRNYTDAPTFSFWNGNRVKTILGIRYYTETLNSTNSVVTGSMIVFEKAITSLYSIGGDFLDTYSSLFLPTLSGAPDQAMLALTVIRQQSTYEVASYSNPGAYTLDYDATANTRDTRALSRVVNITAQQDNYVTLLNDEEAAITNAYDTVWIPTGDDPAIVGIADADVINVKSLNQVTSIDGSLAVDVVTDTPTGDLGTLYVSVTEGSAPPTSVSTDISGDLSGEGDIKSYTGEQGTILPGTAASYATFTGTVQAWVYISGATNTAGIVHAGKKSDFSDELWSLQFLGSSTAPVFSLSAQQPYTYDYLVSSQKLNLRKWHHIVATWDLSGNFIKLYVNGRARGSTSFNTVTQSSIFAEDSPIVIGSQFFDDTEVLTGYYGFEGKINGVLIDDRVWTASEISTFYEANKVNTSSW